MILLSSLCLRVKRKPLLGQKNSNSNNHIDMVCRVLLTGMDQKREKLIIGEKKESELYTPFPHDFCFSSVYISTQPTLPSLPCPLPFFFSLSLSLSHWKSHTLHGVFFLSLSHTMPRRGGGRRGGGRGRGGTAPSCFSPVPSPAVSQPSSVASPSSSAPPPPQPSSSSVAELTSGVKERLNLQDRAAQPSSSKALVIPRRPGYGSVGKKIEVRANHFLVEVADRDLHHYDVSIPYTNFVYFMLFSLFLCSKIIAHHPVSYILFYSYFLNLRWLKFFFSLLCVLWLFGFFQCFFFKCLKLMIVLM